MPESNSAKIPLIAFFVYLFAAFYGPGWLPRMLNLLFSNSPVAGIGPIPSIYFSEAFPLSHREIGAAFTICVNNSVGSALGLTFPALLARITPTGKSYRHKPQCKRLLINSLCQGAFGFYAGLNIVAFVVIFFIVPETKKRTLEELDYIFGVPTTRHASYQVNTWLPWFVKRNFLWQRSTPLPPLYQESYH